MGKAGTLPACYSLCVLRAILTLVTALTCARARRHIDGCGDMPPLRAQAAVLRTGDAPFNNQFAKHTALRTLLPYSGRYDVACFCILGGPSMMRHANMLNGRQPHAG